MKRKVIFTVIIAMFCIPFLLGVNSVYVDESADENWVDIIDEGFENDLDKWSYFYDERWDAFNPTYENGTVEITNDEAKYGDKSCLVSALENVKAGGSEINSIVVTEESRKGIHNEYWVAPYWNVDDYDHNNAGILNQGIYSYIYEQDKNLYVYYEIEFPNYNYGSSSFNDNKTTFTYYTANTSNTIEIDLRRTEWVEITLDVDYDKRTYSLYIDEDRLVNSADVIYMTESDYGISYPDNSILVGYGTFMRGFDVFTLNMDAYFDQIFLSGLIEQDSITSDYGGSVDSDIFEEDKQITIVQGERVSILISDSNAFAFMVSMATGLGFMALAILKRYKPEAIYWLLPDRLDNLGNIIIETNWMLVASIMAFAIGIFFATGEINV